MWIHVFWRHFCWAVVNYCHTQPSNKEEEGQISTSGELSDQTEMQISEPGPTLCYVVVNHKKLGKSSYGLVLRSYLIAKRKADQREWQKGRGHCQGEYQHLQFGPGQHPSLILRDGALIWGIIPSKYTDLLLMLPHQMRMPLLEGPCAILNQAYEQAHDQGLILFFPCNWNGRPKMEDRTEP